MRGRIVQTHNRFYQVMVNDETTYLCNPKGRFKKQAQQEYRLPVIGDWVNLELKPQNNDGVDGYITDIEPRHNSLARTVGEGYSRKDKIMAANLDHILVVSALGKPGVDPFLLDRYIVACELAHIPVVLLFNKTDLVPDWRGDEVVGHYQALGYPTIGTSTKVPHGIDDLRDLVGTGVSLFTGNSGVGKSSLINKLVPEADLATNAVEEKKGLGRHTTTNSILIQIGAHGFLADSPGLRDFAPPLLPAEEVRFGFIEIAEAQSHCRFPSCLHRKEPKCAVKRAVDEGIIAAIRYQSYLMLLGEMERQGAVRFQ